ncbi:hypothetical protein PORY_002821 [Pneumocystis oryctolagi]|uniref:Uncharacterized protein n=1 Tax=Pneumocystis oryctolagi TaxID=42067 RepID=A0ACB7CAF1_9ASCO|nr:hypothetical protein PORY_002821 [Pneumocystis oryctolagi]
MLKGGVIMDVVNVEQARIAEEAGACAVMALERSPSDIHNNGEVLRMPDPEIIKKIMSSVTIPVMAKSRIGHFVEAQILEAIGVDFIDESEALTPADDIYYINKHDFSVPFICGSRNLGEALRRISEGAAMIRTRREKETGNIIETVRHVRSINSSIKKASTLSDQELFVMAKEIQAPYELLKKTAKLGRLPVVNFAAGGIVTPADAALMMQLGCDGIFVSSDIFKSDNPVKHAFSIVKAVTYYKKLSEISIGLSDIMNGINCTSLNVTFLAIKKMDPRGIEPRTPRNFMIAKHISAKI